MIMRLFLLSLAVLLPFPGQGAFAASCVTAQCHVSIASLKQQHAPVKEGDCQICHTQVVPQHPTPGGKSFDLTADDGDLCKECHDGIGQKKRYRHDPVQEGACTACHKPHGSGGRYLLDGEDQNQLCFSCHDDAPFKVKFMHGPAAVGNCTECHDPHASNEKALLKGAVRDLCLKCHADFAQAMAAAGFTHPPVKEGPCTACHNPHGSDVKMFLKQPMPELCIGCHTKIGKKMKDVKVKHKPLTEEQSCANCHLAHYSPGKGLLISDQVSTCLLCHGVDNLGNPALKNIKKDMEGKKNLHGPIKKGQCKDCHDPHGSGSFRLLRGNYPSELYINYKEGTYDGCLLCHEKNLLRFPETTLYTKFRNGKRNLHYVHVSKSRKGRTCRICHEPHASDMNKMINKDGLQFGEWKIPLNWQQTNTGGSCLPGCHKLLKYDRVKPATY